MRGGAGAGSPGPSSCPLVLPPLPSDPFPRARGDGASETFGPVKGHEGQRGSCLRAEKLAVCLEGSSSRFSSPLPWPGLGVGWELCSGVAPAARPWAASPIGTRERASLWHSWKALDESIPSD